MSSKHLNEFSDQSALLSLKDSITEDPYGILTHNWIANTSVCNWFAVYCGVHHRRVTALDLGGMGLVGIIPPEIGNLSFLSFINISHNKFHGSLPFELGHLRRLKVMSIRVNDISGEIPPSIGMLQQLQHLNVGYNSLSGNDFKNTSIHLYKYEPVHYTVSIKLITQINNTLIVLKIILKYLFVNFNSK